MGEREKVEAAGARTYLGLVAQSVGAVNPDVLSKALALLVKFHVF